MANQASVNHAAPGHAPGASSMEMGGVAEFVDSLASLAELQGKLAAADLGDSARRAAVPIVLTLLGISVIVASIGVALLGGGWLLASALKIEQGWAMLFVAAGAIVVGGLAAGVGGMLLSHSFESFSRSRNQLWLNLAWVRAVLVTTAASRANPRHRS